MKKALSLLLAFLLAFSLCLGLVSCENGDTQPDAPASSTTSSENSEGGNKDSDSNNGSASGDQSPITTIDLAGYVANISDATALGISKSAKANTTPTTSRNTSSPSFMPLSAITMNSTPQTQNKHYIMKSKNSAPNGDDNLDKITFTKNEKTITQDELGLEFDKLYVMGDYTFISLVTEGKSQRPDDDVLVFDTDGIATYDKCDYITNSDRQSYIIHNTSGYIYKIANFNIKEIKGNCLLSADNNFIYDFKVNSNNEVEIFSLFQNDTIEWYSCFKDKYGNKFIQNNRLNTYDATTNTYFYVFEPLSSNNQYHRDVNYELTSANESIKLSYVGEDGSINSNTDHYLISKTEIVLQNGATRNLTAQDSFDIHYDKTKHFYVSSGYCTENNLAVYKVANGIVYAYSHMEGYGEGITLQQYDAVNNISSCYGIHWEDNNYFNTDFLEEFDIIIEYYNGALYYYDSIWSTYSEVAILYEEDSWHNYYFDQSLTKNSDFNAHTVLEECSVENNAILSYGVAGNTYYDIVAEKVNGEVVINQYVKGTYQKPQVKIILQALAK